MTYENRLVPVMREGVDLVKMILFKKMRDHLMEKYPGKERAFVNRVSGAVINELFCTPNNEKEFVEFVRNNREVIQEELKGLAVNFEQMRIPLTDALRVQFLCDDVEGFRNEAMLKKARDLGILMVDRDVPLPKNFLNLVRRLGYAFNLLQKEEAPST